MGAPETCNPTGERCKQALPCTEGCVEIGQQEAARPVVDGRGLKVKGRAQGSITRGTRFDHATQHMCICMEEIFAPVPARVRATDVGDALDLVNAHEDGNAVACSTSDGTVARAFARRVQVGMVRIKVPIPVPMPRHGFGGWKCFLFGDMHALGEAGVRLCTRQKSLMQRWAASAPSGAEFAMPTAT
jgi:malonate-semialdehyde dehydrogenase (acetylating) / methylmalonate-semialdehyde dehydrogenase